MRRPAGISFRLAQRVEEPGDPPKGNFPSSTGANPPIAEAVAADKMENRPKRKNSCAEGSHEDGPRKVENISVIRESAGLK
jgi:hypothetical protein